MPDLASLQIAVDSRQVKTAEKDLKSFNKESGKTENATKGMTKGFGSMTSALKLLAPALGAISIGAMAKQMIDVARETQNMKAQLLTMTGSVTSASLAFDRLNQFAKETPYTLKQSIDGFVKLKALGLDPSERAMKSYGNTAAAMGFSMIQMVEAVADASTHEFERLRAFGIRAKQQGENVTFTFRGVETTIKKSSENIQKYLMNIGEVDFAGAMANKVNTIDGQLSNLEGAVRDFWAVLGEGLSVSENVKKAIESVSTAINNLTKSYREFFKTQNAQEYADLQTRWMELTPLVKEATDWIDRHGLSTEGLSTTTGIYVKVLEEEGAELEKINKRMETLDLMMGNAVVTQEEVNKELGAADAHYKAWLKHLDDAKTGIEGVNKALEETCERVRKALSCEDKLLFEYDEIAKATYDRAQAIKDLDYALQNSFMTTEIYIKSLQKIEDEYKNAIDGTKNLTKETKKAESQTVKSTENMGSAWEELNDNIQSEFIDTFVEMLTGGEADFEDFARSIAKMWLNTTLNMAFNPQMSASGGGASSNLASTQTGSFSGGTDLTSVIKTMTGTGDFAIFASGNDFSFSELSKVIGGTNQVGFITGVPQTAGVMGPTMPTAVAQSSGFSSGAINGASGFVGGLVANQIGGWEGVAAGAAVSVGSMAAMGTLAAMGPAGWAALAVSLIMGSGVLGGNSDVTPDLNVGGFFGGSRKGAYTNSLGSEGNGTYDPVFGYQGIFGTMGVGTQHDGFDSEEAAQNFINGVTAQFATMDNSIAEALGTEMTDLVVSAMGTMQLPELKGEDSEDWTATLEEHYRMVFGTAMNNAAEITGDEDWGIWETLAGDMQSIVYVTTEYVAAQGELKSLYEEMLDIHSKDANIIAEQMGNWEAVNGVMEMLGVNLYEVNLSGVDAANALVEAAGGLLELANLTGYFYETFYSAQEKGAHYTKLYADTVGDLNEKYNTHISTSTEAYKHWTLEILNNADASAELKVAMLELAPVTAQVIQAEQAATAEREAYIAVVERAIEAGMRFSATIDDLLLSFTDNPDMARATRDKQAAIDAFGIDSTALTFTESDLKGFLEYLDTVEITGDAAELAKQRANDLVNSFYRLDDAMTDVANAVIAASAAMAQAQADLKAQSQSLAERFNDDLAISNLEDKWGPRFSAIDSWLDTAGADFGYSQADIDAYKLEGASNTADLDSRISEIGKLISAVDSKVLDEKYGDDFVNRTMASIAEYTADSARYLSLTETDAYGGSTNPALSQQFASSTDRIVDINIELENSINDLISNFDQFISAVKDLRKSIDANIVSIRRTQPGWGESDYQDTMINALTKTLTGGEGDLDIYNEIQAAIMARYNAELELISEAKTETENLYASFENIGQYLDKLQLSSVSPLTASERLAESKAQYESTLLSAQGGDVDALNNIASATDAYLVEARTYYASSLEYSNIWDRVNAALESLVGGNQTSFTEYEQSKVLLDTKTIDELNAIDRSVVSLQFNTANNFVTQTDSLLSQMTSDTSLLLASINKLIGINTDAVNPINDYENPDTERLDLVISLYDEILNKTATDDPAGIDYWTNVSTVFNEDLRETLETFVQPSREDLVSSIYTDVLSKPNGIDQKGEDYWTNISTVPYEELYDVISSLVPSHADGTDYTAGGLSFLHKGEAVLTSGDNAQLHTEIKMLREEVSNLRKDQVKQTNAIIVSNNNANEKNANDIIESSDNRKPVVIA